MSFLTHGGLALAALDEQLLQPGVKGLPISEPMRQGAIGVQGWNVLHADTSFPVAVLKLSALRHNLDWMRDFCTRHGVMLAPHGKTTMSPQLFGAQLANGAWGVTLATVPQVQLAHRFGVRRVLLANQLVAPADIASMLRLLQGDPDFGFYALADSLDGVARLAAATRASRSPCPCWSSWAWTASARVAAAPRKPWLSRAPSRPRPACSWPAWKDMKACCRTWKTSSAS